MLMLVKLFLRLSSSSSKASVLEGSSSTRTSVAKASSRMTYTHVVAAKADFKVSVESSSKVMVESARGSSATSTSVLWVRWAVLPKVSSFMASARLITLLLGFLEILCFLLCAVFLIRKPFLLLAREGIWTCTRAWTMAPGDCYLMFISEQNFKVFKHDD